MKNDYTKYKQSINKFFSDYYPHFKKKSTQILKGILSDKNTERLTNLSCHHLIKHYNIYEGDALEISGRFGKQLFLNKNSQQGRDLTGR